MNKHFLSVAITSLALLSFGQLATAHEQDEDNDRQEQQGDPRYYNSRYEGARYPDPRFDDDRDGHRQFDHGVGGNRLQYEVDHLNRMVAHVQGELRRYGADRHIAREYQHVREEAWQVRNQFRRGEQFYNRRALRAEIEHIHGELHHIEQELHVRANEWYQWR